MPRNFGAARMKPRAAARRLPCLTIATLVTLIGKQAGLWVRSTGAVPMFRRVAPQLPACRTIARQDFPTGRLVGHWRSNCGAASESAGVA